MRRGVAQAFCVFSMAAFALIADAKAFVDPLDQPAEMSERALTSSLMDVTHTGNRTVAVGPRGHILFSDDNGQSWHQAPVPVSTDLTAVNFPTAQYGWAVGHDGVVLHSKDGGSTWVKQLDGREIAQLMVSFYRARLRNGDPEMQYILEEARQLASEPPAFPLLDVWFRSEREGFVVGAFNLILHTVDGGESWQPWIDRTDNPQRYHFYAIDGSGKDVYIAGELGLLLRLDEQQQRFTTLPSPYDGSFFGVLVKGPQVVAYGLRGNAYQSLDGGQYWQRLETPSESSLTAGIMVPGMGPLLINKDGGLLTPGPSANVLMSAVASAPYPTHSAALTVDGRGVTLVGPFGSKIVRFD